MSGDLERIVPDLIDVGDPLERRILDLHEDRYRFAARHVVCRDVVDAACGVGYGSAILRAAGARTVHGIDISADAIEHARRRYAAPGIEFSVGDVTTLTVPRPADAVVALEAIEHLPDPAGFVRRAAEIVGPGGIVVASVPTTFSSDVNEFHLHDMTASDLHALFARSGLVVVAELAQVHDFSIWSLLRVRRRRRYGRPHQGRYYARHPRQLLRRLIQTARMGAENRYLVLAGRRS